MTLDELNEHLELRGRLEKAEEMLAALREAACPGAQVLTGMPHTPGIKDKVGDLAAEIADMDARISFLESEIERTKPPIIAFIETVEDIQLRLIFRLRFIRGLAWKEVAAVIGGRNSEDSVKMACYRYLGK